MNSINSVNGASANQPMKSGETTQAKQADVAAQTRRQDETAAAERLQQGRDTFQRTSGSNISDLVAQVERVPETLRQDKVAQAQQRVSQGYYNQSDVLENVAIQLINTGT